MSENRILIAATFTAEPIADALSFWSREFRWSAEIEFAPFNQVFQQLLDPSSSLRTNEKGINVVIVRLEDWFQSDESNRRDRSEPILKSDQLAANADDFVKAIKAAADSSSGPILVAICPSSEDVAKDPVLGPTFLRAEERVIAALDLTRGVYLIRSSELQSASGDSPYLDAESDALGRIPYTSLGFAALGTIISRKIRALRSDPYKVVVLDCDQTLWKGVVGEDGVAGIQIDPARTLLQEFLAEQRQAGMLVCLCSRNEEDDVIRVFRERTDLPLRLDDFTSCRINWEPKSENLKSLAAELNLGLDSFIFIDDDPVMCAEVRMNCPEVVTLQFPDDDAAIPEFIQHLWAFDRVSVTSEDRKRPELYAQNAQREKLREASQSFEEFMAGLCLELKISEISEEQAARVSQLTQRTNQFNFTNRRRSEEEVHELIQSGLECLVVELSDRFGAYGLVGAMMFNTTEGTLCVETLLLSCRALGRGVEHRMLAKLGDIAFERGCDRVDLSFSRSAKNEPALRFLEGLGAQVVKKADGESVFSIPSDRAVELKHRSYSAKGSAGSERPIAVAAGRSDRGNDTAGSQIFERICSDLNSPQRVLEAMRASKRIETPRSNPGFGATNPEESRLKEIFQDILGIQDVGVDDSFFDLGGTSILAVRLFADIERQFGRNLPLATLFEAVTIRQLAGILQGQSDRSRWTSLVSIQPEGSRPPLFCVHAAGGNVLFYRDLAKHLGADQPVYGLQAKGLERRRLAHNRVEDMAAHYIAEIRMVQREGPYYLAGACFGGLVVYEMCQQLLAQGEVVALAALFNTRVPASLKLLSTSDRLLAHAFDVLKRAEHHVGSLLLLPPRQKITYLIGKSNKAWRVTLRQLRRLKTTFKHGTYGRILNPVPEVLAVTPNAIKEAEANYQAEIYPDRITLFRASRQPSEMKSDPTLGWGDLVLGLLEIHEVPGYHAAIITEPRVQVTAKVLADCLERAYRSHESVSPRGTRLVATATA
jgi:FkbH-like protein